MNQKEKNVVPFLDLVCTKCSIRPSEVEIIADTIICGDCKDLNLLEKNPYLFCGKFPFLVHEIVDIERFKYLHEIKRFDQEGKND